MEGSGKIYRVGYAMQPNKVSSVVQPPLVDLAKRRGIHLIQVDLSKPLVEQGPFHCLVHKLYTPAWNQQLLDFHSKYPDAILIDCPSAIQRIHNRISMLQAVTSITIPPSHPHISIGIPKQVVASDAESLLSDSTLTLNFPVIAKPLLANGNDNSHQMCLVFNSSALNKVTPPVVLQEFVNHGGVLFKVYVAGNHVKCVQRTSLPDVSDNQLNQGGILPFSQISGSDAPAHQYQQEPPLEFIHLIAKGLREATKLHLFNFDMIRDAKSANTRYLIIDINYFPGFAKVSGYETILTDFFWDVVNHNHKPDVPAAGAADVSQLTQHTPNQEDEVASSL